MIVAAISVGIILIFLVFLASYINSREDGKFSDGLTLGVIITILLFVVLCIIEDVTNNNPYPTAMDVYQGKTTLEYKVVDGVKVDSVVVFKNDVTELNIY